MTIAIYPGSFDPFTTGHLDILKKGSEIFDKVIVAVAYNSQKQGFLPIEKRLELIRLSVNNLKNVSVDSFEGLTVDYARTVNATVLLRGLRNSLDFEYELQLSQTNSAMFKELKTVFLITKPELGFISSSMIREIYTNNGDVSEFVPPSVNQYLKSIRGI